MPTDVRLECPAKISFCSEPVLMIVPYTMNRWGEHKLSANQSCSQPMTDASIQLACQLCSHSVSQLSNSHLASKSFNPSVIPSSSTPMAVLVHSEPCRTDVIAIKRDYWSGVWSLIARGLCVLPCMDSINRRRYDSSRSIESLQRGLLSDISLTGSVHKDLNGFVADRLTASVMDVGQRWVTCHNGSQAVSPGSTAQTPMDCT